MINKNIIYSNKGVSIIEALLAAVIVGIGFISVYTMTTTATRMIYSASQRDNDTLSTAMIMDDMALDSFSVADTAYHESISSSKYNNLDLTKGCGAAPTGSPKQKDKQKVKVKRQPGSFSSINTDAADLSGGVRRLGKGSLRPIQSQELVQR